MVFLQQLRLLLFLSIIKGKFRKISNCECRGEFPRYMDVLCGETAIINNYKKISKNRVEYEGISYYL